MIAAWLNQRKSLKQAAASLYQAAVLQSRDPRFYTDLGVSDNLDGRFDMVSLHVFLIMERLQYMGRGGKRLSQFLFDHMFVSMEQTLREMGIGDMGVPKHMKRMMGAFNGRVYSYHAAIINNDLETLEIVVAKNIYRVEGGERPSAARMMAEYISQQASWLLQQDYQSMAAGRVSFHPIATLKEAYA